jgi:Bacterial regulatory helix-turn-helix protein, lysR family/LysR substrate binding domain
LHLVRKKKGPEMELMQLEMFLAVLEERTMDKAAERVCRTQPAVSLGLSRLEGELGGKLLERPRRGEHRLTARGEILYEYASQIIRSRDEVLALLTTGKTPAAGRLRVGLSTRALSGWMSRPMDIFLREHPNVRMELLCDGAGALLEDLTEGRMDLACFAEPPDPSAFGGRLAMVPLPMSEAMGSSPGILWMLHRRLGCSWVTKAFEEVLVSLSTSRTERRLSSRSRKRVYLARERVVGVHAREELGEF